MITQYIIDKSGLKTEKELSNANYQMFNTGGVECEVGEFLYSLIRMLKPKKILETGTHFGISSSYMALGLKHNNLGGIVTTIDPIYYPEARSIHKKLDVETFINQIELHAEKVETTDMFDIVFLDSEPILRFDEFVKFFKNVMPSGFIIIHDLHSHLSYNSFNPDHPDFKHWPYGSFVEKLGPFFKENLIQTISFPTPRGLILFQKNKEDMSYIKYIKGIL